MCENSIKPQGEGNENRTPDENNMDINEDDEVTEEEFEMLDKQLDALNSALDDIEQRNDDLHAQLIVLLEANREIRKQIQDNNVQGIQF